jgi:hypothetical protein
LLELSDYLDCCFSFQQLVLHLLFLEYV